MTQIRKRSEAGCVKTGLQPSVDGQHSGHRGRPPARRRLVLVSQHGVAESSDHEWDPNTVSIEGTSDVKIHDVVEPTVVPKPIDMDRVRAPGGAFSSLDAVAFCPISDARSHVVRDQSCFAGNHQWCGVSKRVEEPAIQFRVG